jgi:hypothetical protein
MAILHSRNILLLIIAITTLSFNPGDKDLQRIIKDGKFAKLPINAKIIGKEMIRNNGERFGYLIFESDSNQIKKWITGSRLTLTSTTEMFENNIMVWPKVRPNWFLETNKPVTMNFYYAKRKKNSFITICIVDMVGGTVKIEYQMRD